MIGELDALYIDRLAHDIAERIHRGDKAVAVAYEPGNLTRYEMIIGRVSDFRIAAGYTSPFRGTGDGTRYFLVGVVNHGCYPIAVGGSPGYVGDKLGMSSGDGEAIVALVNQVAEKLDGEWEGG